MKYYWSTTVVLRPHADVRIRGKALDWFKSYLSGRSQRIAVQGTMPHQFDLDCGVPQGSCLGPYYLFIFMRRICLKLLKNIFQLYPLFRRGHTTLPFKPDDTNRQIDAISTTNKCNQLRLILPVLLLLVNMTLIQVCVRNLGVWFDSQLSISTHVAKLCNSTCIITGTPSLEGKNSAP